MIHCFFIPGITCRVSLKATAGPADRTGGDRPSLWLGQPAAFIMKGEHSEKNIQHL